MAKTDSLNVFASNGVTAEKLAESYAEVLDMIQRSAISMQLKNTNFSGDPTSGSVEVRRLMTAGSQAYGTARTAGAGDAVKNNGVTINLDQDKEIVEELERKDVALYGIPELIAKRVANHQLAMVRDLDNAFFAEAESAGSEETITSTTIEDQIEELIQSVETLENDNVDGVPRDMLAVTVTPAVFGQLRNYIDSLANPLNGGVNVNLFHDVKIFANTRQTEDAICMAVGAIGQPVLVEPYKIQDIPLSNAVGVALFYSYGTQAVMADLIRYASLSAVSA